MVRSVRAVFVTFLLLLVAAAGYAEPVTYVLETPGVV